jgi:hypothetical protein
MEIFLHGIGTSYSFRAAEVCVWIAGVPGRVVCATGGINYTSGTRQIWSEKEEEKSVADMRDGKGSFDTIFGVL